MSPGKGKEKIRFVEERILKMKEKKMKEKKTGKKQEKRAHPILAVFIICVVVLFGTFFLNMISHDDMRRWIFLALSFASAVIFGFLAFRRMRSKEHGVKILSALHLFTIGVFVSLVFLLFPLYRELYLEDSGRYVFSLFFRQLFASVHHTLRVFILDGEYKFLTDNAESFQGVARWFFFAWGAVLFVVAPFLTFSNLLSLFKELRSEIRLIFWQTFFFKSKFYIFSELNERSIAMAESIHKKYFEEKKKIKNKTVVYVKDGKKKNGPHIPIIVFTDVFPENGEIDYDLRMKAADIQAILLKKDIARVALSKEIEAEFFLIGNDSSENLQHAIKLTERNNGKPGRRIYLFSSKQSDGYVLDSLKKGPDLFPKRQHWVKKIQEELDSTKNDQGYLENVRVTARDILKNTLSVRRIDCVDSLATSTLTDPEVLGALRPREGEPKEINVMILGTGEHGVSFLKNALSLYQIYGYRLNVFLLDKEDKGAIISKLRRDWTEIEFDWPYDKPQDSCYQIRVFGGVDFETAEINKVFEENKNLFRKVRFSLVALGDDEKNIEVAVKLRRLFDRLDLCGKDTQGNRSDDLPLIYSIVYNETMSGILTEMEDEEKKWGLRDYATNLFHVRFIGGMQELYSYEKVIEKFRKDEEDAFLIHFSWAFHTAKILAFQNLLKNNKFRPKNAQDKVILDEIKNLSINMQGEKDIEIAIGRYISYEYPLISSIATVNYQTVYRTMEQGNLDSTPGGLFCLCNRCVAARISEHMRWNMFMRTRGYRYGTEKSGQATRALIQRSLLPWNELSAYDKLKDSTIERMYEKEQIVALIKRFNQRYKRFSVRCGELESQGKWHKETYGGMQAFYQNNLFSLVFRLVVSDRKITDEEAKCLNRLFDFKYSAEKLAELYNATYDHFEEPFRKRVRRGYNKLQKISKRMAASYLALLNLICKIVMESDGTIESEELKEVKRITRLFTPIPPKRRAKA